MQILEDLERQNDETTAKAEDLIAELEEEDRIDLVAEVLVGLLVE